MTVDLPAEGKYGLVGRVDEMAGLELAFQKAQIVLLTGPAGAGKTELACGFARRRLGVRESQANVFFTSFEYGAGLCRVLHEMGTTLRGISFARLSLERQRRWIVDFANQNPCMLIWDNFENVFDYLDTGECKELVDFLREIGDGPSHVLITGRGKDWVDDTGMEYATQELRGLNHSDAQKLAGAILDGAGVDVAALDSGYPQLLTLLDGNPMSMRVVLPHLKQSSPAELAQAFESFGQVGGEDALNLDAALECSFSRLSSRTRAHLPFLGLFRERVLLDVLTFMTQGEVYVSVMGEKMGWGACRTFLREARDCGILDSIPPSVFVVPPEVSRFLSRELHRRLTPAQVGNLEQEFVRVYADLGDYFIENLSSENSESTVTGVLAEEANLLRALRRAESGARWEHAQLILQPLGQVYKMQERVTELRRLRQRLLAHVGPEAEQAERRGAVDAWTYLQGTEINDAIARMELDKAEGLCHTVLAYLESSDDPGNRPKIASIHHQLGLITLAREEYDQAEAWCHKALEVNEYLGNEAESADSYHQLGLIAQHRRLYDEAGNWHRKALEIRQQAGDEAESAIECHQLALVAEASDEFQDALEWYHKARSAFEGAADKAGAAEIYHRLGLIAQAQYDYEEATGWYQRALLAYQEMEDEDRGASDCYQLGIIALARYEYQEAEDWFRQALSAHEGQGNEAAVATSYHQLGVVAHTQQRHQDAEGWYEKALEVLVRLGDENAAASTWGQLGLLADHRGNYAHAVWYLAHTYEIAAARQLPLLRQVKLHLSRLRSKMGTESFIECWQEVSDSDVLAELA